MLIMGVSYGFVTTRPRETTDPPFTKVFAD